MRPVKTELTELVYRGPTPDIGDLWCHRVTPGQIMSVWEPTDEERKLVAEGGNVVLWIHSEPIPPVALEVLNEYFTKPVADHPFKIIPELEDTERQS